MLRKFDYRINAEYSFFEYFILFGIIGLAVLLLFKLYVRRYITPVVVEDIDEDDEDDEDDDDLASIHSWHSAYSATGSLRSRRSFRQPFRDTATTSEAGSLNDGSIRGARHSQMAERASPEPTPGSPRRVRGTSTRPVSRSLSSSTPITSTESIPKATRASTRPSTLELIIGSISATPSTVPLRSTGELTVDPEFPARSTRSSVSRRYSRSRESDRVSDDDDPAVNKTEI